MEIRIPKDQPDAQMKVDGSTPKGIPSGKKRYKIAVKVVDIFGNDTMKVIEVGV